MDYRKPAIVLTIVACLIAALLGYFYYRSTKSLPSKIGAVEQQIELMKANVEGFTESQNEAQREVNNIIFEEVKQRAITVQAGQRLEAKIMQEVDALSESPNIEELPKQIDSLKAQIDELKKQNQSAKGNKDLSSYIPKLAFSVIFCAAALFVILSGKFQDETTKWAYGIINVIVGVWIGTAI